MKTQNNIFLLGIVLVCFFGLSQAQKKAANCATAKPTLKANETYTMNQNCTKGSTYNIDANGTTPAMHCHCWSYCGYICAPRSSTITTKSPVTATTKSPVTGTTTAATTTTATTTTTTNTTTTAKPCKTPTVPAGSKWVANAGCRNGTTYDITPAPVYHCHCYSFCGYICDPKP